MAITKLFSLNGHFYIIDKTINLLELISYFNYNDSVFVLEYNNLIYNKKDWKNIFIKNQDKIELITIVGGG